MLLRAPSIAISLQARDSTGELGRGLFSQASAGYGFCHAFGQTPPPPTTPTKPPATLAPFSSPHPRSQKRARREGFVVYVPKVLNHEGCY